MAQESNTQKTKDILNKTNKFVGSETLVMILFVVLVFVISYISKEIYSSKTESYKDEIYTQVNKNILNQYEIMLKEKLNTSTLISSSLSKNESIKNALIKNNSTILNMDSLLEEMRTTKEYADIQAEVIDFEGISFKRSWTYLAGDDLIRNDQKLAHLVKYPRVKTSIESSKYGMTLTNKIPIYQKDKFLGLFGVNIHFDSLVDLFAKSGFQSVILLNEIDSKNIVQELSYSKKFVGDCYVVNSNASSYLLKLLKQTDVEMFCGTWEDEYLISKKSDHLVSKFIIKNKDNISVAKAIIFKPLDEINYEDLDFFQKIHILLTIFIIILCLFLIKYFYMIKKVKDVELENSSLVVINDDLKGKTDELDYKQKELDNLFDNQPNLMFMHDGKAITKVNRRFIKGFFRRFKTFEGFREKHRCVSELFEKYDGPNYICEQLVDGKYWVDYILDDPRKLYKTVMSVDGDPHHFIIKLNEMGYNKQSSERSLIVALVDMTADWLYYKNLMKNNNIIPPKNEIKDKVNISKEEKEEPKVLEKKPEPKEKNIKIDISKSNNPKVKKDVKKQQDKTFNPYALIQLSLSNVLKETLSTTNIKLEKKSIIDIEKIKDKNLLEFDNKFLKSDSKTPLSWSLIIPIESISRVFNMMTGDNKAEIVTDFDTDLLAISEEIINNMKIKISKMTNNEIKLIVNPVKVCELSKLNRNNVKIFDLGIDINNNRLSVFLMLKGNIK
ncbi:MAG: hypothetical protein U9O56_10665 [Campylobacterota bacterium]|nr:hypothetical protein [Campylobacterota bacterium]